MKPSIIKKINRFRTKSLPRTRFAFLMAKKLGRASRTFLQATIGGKNTPTGTSSMIKLSIMCDFIALRLMIDPRQTRYRTVGGYLFPEVLKINLLVQRHIRLRDRVDHKVQKKKVYTIKLVFDLSLLSFRFSVEVCLQGIPASRRESVKVGSRDTSDIRANT